MTVNLYLWLTAVLAVVGLRRNMRGYYFLFLAAGSFLVIKCPWLLQ